MRTQVGIVGSGPAGLMLSHILHRHGIESVILEQRSRDYVLGRIRAGVLEQATVDLLVELGLDSRMKREGLIHTGIELQLDGQRHRIDFDALTGGRAVTVYGQTEITRDMMDARLAQGGQTIYEAEDVSVHGIETSKPSLRFRHNGDSEELQCDFIVGCDGFHGVCRPSFPAGVIQNFERVYPYGWLGILANVAPSSEELVYAYHDRGFALLSMRSTQVSRLYIQVAPDEDLKQWPDDRVWDELSIRLGTPGWTLRDEKSVTPMRSFVAEPMQHGRLFLAGDAAHIVPPTGAKGLNLAASDVKLLSDGLISFYATGNSAVLDGYSRKALERVWRAEHFSWFMTSMLHRTPEGDAFERKLQRSQLAYIFKSRAAAASLAENYVGLPFD
ncbi:MAG: 4-hydroxybenzoate 3-monooxygenase [Gammaproteobacteria bacterium]|nr:4-hydroxybenzoate 3-monooxygenase [Gammaproteobacteria bacterium]